MKAYTKTKYGGPEILQFEEVEKPSLKDDHILVKIKANSANPADRFSSTALQEEWVILLFKLQKPMAL